MEISVVVAKFQILAQLENRLLIQPNLVVRSLAEVVKICFGQICFSYLRRLDIGVPNVLKASFLLDTNQLHHFVKQNKHYHFQYGHHLIITNPALEVSTP